LDDPTEALAERFSLGSSSPENAWAFVTEYLGHVPVFFSVDGIAEPIAKRTAHELYDRMVAFHVQRQLSVPLSTAEFLAGLAQCYPGTTVQSAIPVRGPASVSKVPPSPAALAVFNESTRFGG
jgi:hypothetical protein